MFQGKDHQHGSIIFYLDLKLANKTSPHVNSTVQSQAPLEHLHSWLHQHTLDGRAVRKIKGLLFVSNEFQKNSYEKPLNRNRKKALLRIGETTDYNTNTSFSTVTVTNYKKPNTKSPH